MELKNALEVFSGASCGQVARATLGPSTLTQIRERLARASLWLASAKLLNNGLSAVSTIVLARLLVPEDFGIVALAASFIAIAASLTELSLGSALINVEKPQPEHLHTAWTLNLARALVLAFGLCIAADPLAGQIDDPRLEPVFYVMAASLGISGLASPRLAILERDLQFRQTFILSLSTNTVSFMVSIVLAFVLKSYWALVMGTVAGQTVRVAASYLVAPYLPVVSWSRTKELWQFSVWLSLSQMVSTLNYRVDQLIVGLHLGRAELGYYTVGGRLAQLPGREVVAPLTATLFPALSLLRTDPDRLRTGYVLAQTVVTAAALPITALVALFAHPVVLLLMGSNWLGAVPVIHAVAAIAALETLGSLVGPLAMANGQTQLLFRRDVFRLIVRAPLILAGVVFGGFVGLLIGRSLAGFLSLLIDMSLVRSIVGLSLFKQLWVNRRSLVATSAMAVVAILLQSIYPLPVDVAEQFLRLTLLGIPSVAVLLAATVALWWIDGFCDGPEREALGLFKGLLRKLRLRR